MPNHELHQLLSTLSMSEKRYFRLGLTHKGKEDQNQLLALFDFLIRQPLPDDDAAKAAFAGTPMAAQFPVYKQQLHLAVLRSLQAYDYERSPSQRIRSALDKVEILHARGLSAQALRLLRRTRAHACELGQYVFLPEAFQMERKLLRTLHADILLSLLPALEEEESNALTLLAIEAKAIALYDRAFATVQRERRPEREALRQELAALLTRWDELRQSPQPTFTAQAALHNTRALLAQASGDYDTALRAAADLLRLWDAWPRIAQLEADRHARAKAAFLNAAFAAGRLDEHRDQLQAFREAANPRKPTSLRLAFQAWNLELTQLMNSQRLPEAAAFLPAFQQFMDTHASQLAPQQVQTFRLNAAETWFRTRHFAQAIPLLNALNLFKDAQDEGTLYRSSVLLSIIAHLETGALSTAEYLIASAKRRLRAKDAGWEFGRVALGALTRILQAWDGPTLETEKHALLRALAPFQQEGMVVPHALNVIGEWAKA